MDYQQMLDVNAKKAITVIITNATSLTSTIYIKFTQISDLLSKTQKNQRWNQ
jgi:hypothetical protein